MALSLRGSVGLLHTGSRVAAGGTRFPESDGVKDKACSARSLRKGAGSWRCALLSATESMESGRPQARAAAADTAALPLAEAQRPVQFRPCIDIHKGKVKQIVGSSLRDTPPADAPTGPGPEASLHASAAPPPQSPRRCFLPWGRSRLPRPSLPPPRRPRPLQRPRRRAARAPPAAPRTAAS